MGAGWDTVAFPASLLGAGLPAALPAPSLYVERARPSAGLKEFQSSSTTHTKALESCRGQLRDTCRGSLEGIPVSSFIV